PIVALRAHGARKATPPRRLTGHLGARPIDGCPRPGPRRPPHIDRAASRTGTATAPGPRGHTARPGTVSDRAVTLVTADGTAIPVGTVTDRHPRRKDPPCSPDPI